MKEDELSTLSLRETDTINKKITSKKTINNNTRCMTSKSYYRKSKRRKWNRFATCPFEFYLYRFMENVKNLDSSIELSKNVIKKLEIMKRIRGPDNDAYIPRDQVVDTSTNRVPIRISNRMLTRETNRKDQFKKKALFCQTFAYNYRIIFPKISYFSLISFFVTKRYGKKLQKLDSFSRVQQEYDLKGGIVKHVESIQDLENQEIVVIECFQQHAYLLRFDELSGECLQEIELGACNSRTFHFQLCTRNIPLMTLLLKDVNSITLYMFLYCHPKANPRTYIQLKKSWNTSVIGFSSLSKGSVIKIVGNTRILRTDKHISYTLENGYLSIFKNDTDHIGFINTLDLFKYPLSTTLDDVVFLLKNKWYDKPAHSEDVSLTFYKKRPTLKFIVSNDDVISIYFHAAPHLDPHCIEKDANLSKIFSLPVPYRVFSFTQYPSYFDALDNYGHYVYLDDFRLCIVHPDQGFICGIDTRLVHRSNKQKALILSNQDSLNCTPHEFYNYSMRINGFTSFYEGRILIAHFLDHLHVFHFHSKSFEQLAMIHTNSLHDISLLDPINDHLTFPLHIMMDHTFIHVISKYQSDYKLSSFQFRPSGSLPSL